MFRVPNSAEAPTFDATTTISFWRWLTSSRAERDEWMRRRNVASKLALQNQAERGNQARERWAVQKQEIRKAVQEQRRQEREQKQQRKQQRKQAG